MKILVACASAHGSTAEIGEFIARILRAYSVEVDVRAVQDVQDVSPYQAFILGSPIHAGMWLHEFSAFLERFESALTEKPAALFITCIRVMEEGGYEHALAEYVYQPTLQKLGITNVGVFAGKMEVGAINWDERWLLASRYDGTEMSKHVNHDYRDWQAVATWANNVARALELTPTF